MELENVDGTWARNDKDDYEFFIINEAIISKLCILGEDVEPCFEGASISKVEFSFSDNFTNTYSKFIKQMYELINEGGTSVDKELEKVVEAEEVAAEEEVVEEVVDEEIPAEETPEEEEAAPAEEELESEEEESDAEAEEEVSESEEEEAPAEEEEPAPVPEFRVEDTEEYQALLDKVAALEAENASLKEFKLAAERKDKEAMINSFYMLSDEEKQDVINNIDTYSLDDIEAKLSIICVRNKVSFNLDEENKEKEQITFSLDSEIDDSVTPAWVKAVQTVAKSRK